MIGFSLQVKSYLRRLLAATLVVLTFSSAIFADLTKEEAALDAEIQRTWSLFLERLSKNDAEGAANLIGAAKRKQFLQIFEEWGNDLNQMADGWSVIKAVSLEATFAEYTIFRGVGEAERMHFIMFSKSFDGSWRIAEL